MAPSLKKALKAFIDDIPAAKLENFPGSAGTLHKRRQFPPRSAGGKRPPPSRPFTHQNFFLLAQLTKTAYNLQIQANKGAPNTSVRKAAPQTVATVLRNFESKATGEDVRQAFHRSAEGGGSKITI
jgi:hypothetical protein